MQEVAIGIIEKEGRILMIKRTNKEGNLEWAFPGGKVEEGETEEQACIREVYEETGLHVLTVKRLGKRIHPDTNTNIVYFVCKVEDNEIRILNKNEILEIAYKTRRELEHDIKTDLYEPVKEYIDKYIK